MFGFGKKKKQQAQIPQKPQLPQKSHKKSALDKIIMGAIVGGAVGSVIGMSIAPNKGKDTRDKLMQTGKDLKKGLFSTLAGKLTNKKPQKEALPPKSEYKKIPNEQV